MIETDDDPSLWHRVTTTASQWFSKSPRPSAEIAETAVADIQDLARDQAPVVWLLGKVAAGKSSIVQALTGDSRAVVGEGFRPCTETATVYDFPAGAPAVRFLDTRGLGEVGYDPSADLQVNHDAPHLLMPVMRVGDPVQRPVLDALTAIRRTHPDWPVLAVLTALHETYPPGYGHPGHYPFGPNAIPREDAPRSAIPEALTRAIAHHREGLQALPGKGMVHLVAIDLTQPEDGLFPHDYGLYALGDALRETAPGMIAEVLRSTGKVDRSVTRSEILGHSAAAAASDLVPIAGAVAVPVVWARLLQVLADRYGVDWDRKALTAFLSALGGAVLVKEVSKHGLKQVAKLIPGFGWTAGAAGSAALTFATSYALGTAACVYLADVKAGRPVDDQAIRAAFDAALKEGMGLRRQEVSNDQGHQDQGGSP